MVRKQPEVRCVVRFQSKDSFSTPLITSMLKPGMEVMKPPTFPHHIILQALFSQFAAVNFCSDIIVVSARRTRQLRWIKILFFSCCPGPGCWSSRKLRKNNWHNLLRSAICWNGSFPRAWVPRSSTTVEVLTTLLMLHYARPNPRASALERTCGAWSAYWWLNGLASPHPGPGKRRTVSHVSWQNYQ